MLYDPKWEKPSLAGFKSWLQQQNPNETFDYSDCYKCVVAQYLHSICSSWHTGGETVVMLNKFAYAASCKGHIVATFGEVLREIEEVS